MVGSLYWLLRVRLDVIAPCHGDQAKLQAEVLVLRRQVQVLERQIKRLRWSPGDRTVLAALQERIPRSAWAADWSSRRRCSDGTDKRCAESGRLVGTGRGSASRRPQKKSAS